MMMTKPLRTECCATARAIACQCMRDSQAPMITDGAGDPLGLHRPGWRIAIGGSERDARLRDSQCKAIEEAHAEYSDRLTNAWKGNPPTEGRQRR